MTQKPYFYKSINQQTYDWTTLIFSNADLHHMIVLRYPAANAQLEDWKDTMEKLALAHKLEQDPELTLPVLSHSGAEYRGGQAIAAYLDQLERESEQWWYCTCDRR